VYTLESQKEEFLKEYFRSRVVSTTMVNAVLNRALGNEKRFGKVFYEFTKEEILQMYTDAKVKSNRTLQNWNLTLKHASRWFLHTQGKSLDNAYEAVTRDDLNRCVDADAVKQMLITKEQLQAHQTQHQCHQTFRAFLRLEGRQEDQTCLTAASHFDRAVDSRTQIHKGEACDQAKADDAGNGDNRGNDGLTLIFQTGNRH